MKTKSFFIVLPLLALVSCQREEMEFVPDSPVNGKVIEITAGFGDKDQSTRTTLNSEGKVLWSPGEAINIFYGPSGESSGSKFVSQNTEPASMAVFTGTITAFTGVSEGGEPLSFWGIYPYSEANRCNGSSVVIDFPVVQNAVEENFKDNTIPMVAKAPGLALPFYNVCSMIRFSLVNSNITKVTIRGNNGEILSGRVSVSMGSDGKPVWSDTEGEGSKSVTLNGPDGGTFEAGKFYYIAILPGEFPNGYTMEFNTSDDRYGSRVRNSSITFDRNTVTKQSDRDEGVTFQDRYVDLGLSVKWATVNLGASAPEEFGDYFAWGEVEPKASYSWENYKWYDGTSSTMTKYCLNSSYGQVDGLSVLEEQDDAANAYWGEGWRIPTKEEWTELMNDCNWTWTTENGVEGFKVTGPNGNSIFIPAAGLWKDSTFYPRNNSPWSVAGSYWSSSLGDSNIPYNVDFDRVRPYVDNAIDGYRNTGQSIRPVRDGADTPPVVVHASSVSINKESLILMVEGRDTLVATIEPENAVNKNVTWSSSDNSVAAVDSNGIVTGVSKGTAVITVTTEDGGLTASCSVTVKSFPAGTDFDEDAFISYVANHQEWFNISADNTYYQDTYFPAGVTATRFEMKFQIPDDYSYRPLLHSGTNGYITIDASNIYYCYAERFHEDGDTWYEDRYIAGVESGIDGSGVVVLTASFDGDQISATVNGKETTIPLSASSLTVNSCSIQYLFSSYSREVDDGALYVYHAGIPEGTRLYYVKIWDGDELVYFGHASRAVCSYSSEVEYCWYEEIGNKFTFARNLHTLASAEIIPSSTSSPVVTVRQPFGGGID